MAEERVDGTKWRCDPFLKHFPTLGKLARFHYISANAKGLNAYPMKVTEEAFANLLRGKRIVIVGGAPLEGWGNVIDSFDLVVRVNRGYIASQNAPQHQGSRTDILYSACHSHETHQVNSAPIDLDVFHRLGLKALCFHDNPLREIKDDIQSNTKVPWRIIDEGLIEHLKTIDLSGTKPHTGTIAIKDLLQYEPRELHVMGFTFFQGNQLYSKDFKRWDNQTSISEANRLHGGFESELEWFRKAAQSDKRIKVDQNLHKIMHNSPLLLRDEDFACLVRGKRVALVGPAEYLVGSRLGETIDSFDLVVRMNLGIIDSEELNKDIGRRVDIFYSAMSVETGTAPIEVKTWERLGLKAVVIKNTYSHKRYKNQFEKENKKLPYRFISDPFTQYLHEEIGIRNLHTGIVAIYDLLRFGVSELFLTGFTFFQGKGTYMKEYKGWEDHYAKKRAMMANHNYEKEFQYFLKTLEFENRIHADPHLFKIIRDNNTGDFWWMEMLE